MNGTEIDDRPEWYASNKKQAKPSKASGSSTPSTSNASSMKQGSIKDHLIPKLNKRMKKKFEQAIEMHYFVSGTSFQQVEVENPSPRCSAAEQGVHRHEEEELENILLETPIDDETAVDDERREALFMQLIEYVISAQQEDAGEFSFIMLLKGRKTPFQYWQSDGVAWPDYQKINVKLFTMATSSAASERNFSTVGFIHSELRNSLAPSSVEKLVYLKSNYGAVLLFKFILNWFSISSLFPADRNDHVFYTKENKRVSLVMGNLEDQDTDVIVNTTSAQMNLNCGAVSSALSRKAGPALQAAVNKKKESTEISGDIVDTETTNCRLCCKNVYHISLGKNSPKSLANLEKVVMDCLKLADASQHQSISLPALGTGILGYPPKDVADIVIDAAIQFSKDYPDSTLKLIRVVLFPSNDSIECYICSHDNKRISLLLGKIEDQNTDVIVNTTSVKMKLNVGNVSSALHYKAGPALQASVNREKGSIVNHGDIVNTETTNCNLSCKRVFHVSLVSCSSTEWCPKLKRVVMDCLRLADQFKHQSISLPAMGTGNLSYPAQRVAAMMVGAAIQYYNDCPNSTLKLIQFVLLPSDNSTISEFQKEMQHPSQPLTDPGNWDIMVARKPS
ncbi:protein mono-ADP-ribosyltransferase PARP14-like [Lampetra fluviatilis]